MGSLSRKLSRQKAKDQRCSTMIGERRCTGKAVVKLFGFWRCQECAGKVTAIQELKAAGKF